MTKPDAVNVLLVDDQPGKLLSYEVMLEELGENLVSTSSAKEALADETEMRFSPSSSSITS